MIDTLVTFITCVIITYSPCNIETEGKIMPIKFDGSVPTVMYYDYRKDTLLTINNECKYCYIVVVNEDDCE